jgi:hypothetical protein
MVNFRGCSGEQSTAILSFLLNLTLLFLQTPPADVRVRKLYSLHGKKNDRILNSKFPHKMTYLML